MLNSVLNLPLFARLHDYTGLWCMEEGAFATLFASAQGIDWPTHIRAAASTPRVNTSELVATSGKPVAVIKAMGTLAKGQTSLGGTSTVQLRRDIRQAAGNPEIGSILLAIDSPGGTVSGISDLASDVKAASSRKPVVAHIDDLGASAAYWLASSADAIYANAPTALIGSIGTFQAVYDSSAAAEKAGVKAMIFRTGPLKGIGAPGVPVTEQQQSHVQRMVDDSQVEFDSAVLNGRRFTTAQLEAVRSGAVFGAREAKRLGLIDGIQSLEATLHGLSSR